MVNFEKEIRDGAFDPEVSPMKVIMLLKQMLYVQKK